MATRLYLPASGTAPLASLAVNSNWELTNSLARLPCYTSKRNTALATTTITWPATATQQWCWKQYQSPPMAAGYSWTTSDTVSMVIGKSAETTTNGDTHLAYVVRVVSGDGGTIRGVIGLYHATSTEYALVASAATRIHNARTSGATTFSSQIGDRIIIEIGLHGVTPAAESIQMRFGDPSATSDFALTEGLTTDLCPWVELSRTVTFGHVLTADYGGFTLSGQAAGLRADRRIVAGLESYTLTGQPANLFMTSGNHYTMTAGVGNFAMTGQAAGLRAAKRIITGLGSFSLAGQPAILRRTWRLVAGMGTYQLTGLAAQLFKTGEVTVIELGCLHDLPGEIGSRFEFMGTLQDATSAFTAQTGMPPAQIFHYASWRGDQYFMYPTVMTG